MQKTKLVSMVLVALWLVFGIGGVPSAVAEQTLKFSCSAQLYDILQDKVLNAFTQATGIKVDLSVSSSEAALYRLYNRVSDVAGTAERIAYSSGEYGYVETMVCTAPIVVITHPATTVNGLAREQLRSIFAGEITNWKELGGEDQPIVVVVPDKGTAAYRNFSHLALKRFDIDYAIMTNRSTMVVDVVRHIPGSISFITKGSDARDASIKIVKVDDIAYTEKSYPFLQSFSLVTRGQPSGNTKAFVDFVSSAKTAAMLRANGIFPSVP